MKLIRVILVLLLYCTISRAQIPTQTKGFFGQGQSIFNVTLDKPILKGQAVVAQIYAAGSQWQPGPVCLAASYYGDFCSYNLYDSQGNQFVQVNRDYTGLYYIPASKGGTETITVAYSIPSPQNLSLIVMVFPVTLVLQDVAEPRCDFLPEGNQHQICNPWNSNMSDTWGEDTATLTSYTLTSSVPNELFIGGGSMAVSRPLTPSSGWSVPEWGGEQFLSYKTSGPVGTSETFSVALSPPLGPEQYGYTSIQGFKAIPIQ
jgi:hypothetical protein